MFCTLFNEWFGSQLILLIFKKKIIYALWSTGNNDSLGFFIWNLLKNIINLIANFLLIFLWSKDMLNERNIKPEHLWSLLTIGEVRNVLQLWRIVKFFRNRSWSVHDYHLRPSICSFLLIWLRSTSLSSWELLHST